MPHIKAVILDWAGTTVDFGCFAPVHTIQTVFARHGIDVAEADARRDMGIPKRDHIRRLLSVVDPAAGETDLDRYYAEFIPVQMEILADYSTVIPGVAEAVNRMRSRGIKIGSTTGYTRAMLDILIGRAAEQGYAPDCSMVPEETAGGRPHPYMIYAAALRMQCYPLSAFVKIGDTPADIDEGRNAGTWTVGVSRTGNSPYDELERAGAHFVIDSVADIDPVLEQIEARLAAGQQP